MRAIIGGLIAAMLICSLTGCAMHRYQVCVIAQSGDMGCLSAQDRQSAEMKALAVNAVSGGAAVAWVQKAQHKAKSPAKDSIGEPISQ